MSRVYLDHASSWPPRPEALRAHADAVAVAWADPDRGHTEAATAQELLARASETTARRLGASDGVVWTSSGTEAVALAVLGTARAAERRGVRRRHVVVSAVEHSSVRRSAEQLRDAHGYRLTVVEVDRAGRVDPEEVASAVDDDTLAVHLQHANHEVGTLQPTHEVSLACRRVGAMLHVDACQTVGQLGVTLEQVGADLLSASGAKFGGLPGTGLLALGPRARVGPVVEGDDRQRGRRAGRIDVASVAGTAVALEVATASLETERSTRERLRRRLRERLPDAVEDVAVHGPLAEAHPGIVAASALYVDGEALVAELDRAGFAVHSGSSCASTGGLPSHVLVAMGALTHGHVRASVGPATTDADVDTFVDAWATIVTDLRRARGVPA